MLELGWPCFLVSSIPIFSAMFVVWYLNAVARFEENAAVIDKMFANCTENDFKEIKFGVVIPCIPRQINFVLALLHVWSLPEFYPLFTESSPRGLRARTPLIFYETSSDPIFETTVKTFIKTNPNVAQMLDEVFDSVTFLSRDLPDRFDTCYRDQMHGQWITPGMTEMFYPMMTQKAKELGLTYVLYYELDMLPLRRGWLSRLRETVFSPDADFWFFGSQQRERNAFGGRIHGHMNGNCIVKAGNRCVREFLNRVHMTYRFLPFGTSIMRYLVNQRNLREAQHVMRRMRYTDLIGTFGDERVRRDFLLKKYPEMYLVHGSGYYDDMNRHYELSKVKESVKPR